MARVMMVAKDDGTNGGPGQQHVSDVEAKMLRASDMLIRVSPLTMLLMIFAFSMAASRCLSMMSFTCRSFACLRSACVATDSSTMARRCDGVRDVSEGILDAATNSERTTDDGWTKIRVINV